MTTTQPAPEVIDGEVADTTPPPPAPVPPAAGAGRELKPILASWLKDRGEFTEKVTDAGKRAAHTTAWHTLRSPLHAVRVLLCAPRGLVRVIKAIWGWVFDAEAKPLRRGAVNANQAADWLKLARERKERIHRRWIGLVVMTMLALFVVLFVVSLGPWVAGVAGVLAVGALGYAGRPVDKPLLARATDSSGNPPLRPDLVLRALCALGIAKMNNPEDIRLLSDLTREGTVGSSIELELTEGVTANEVMERRSKLSAGLRRPIGTVWPAVGRRHEAHLVLYVSDEDMATARQKPWPLRRDGAVDVFKPAPVFTDQRGRWVDLTLAYTSGVIGAVPRMGKTFALRELLLVGALDPRCKIYAYDLKGTGDLSCMQLVAHEYGVGDEEDDIAEQLSAMRALREELRRRAKVIRDLPREQCPENKVTTELASRRSLGLEPVMVGVDECQVWFEHEVKAIRDEFIAICTDLVKRGPAVGMICYFATQKPDAKSIPTGIAANAVVRLCFKVEGHISNDQVLGAGAYHRGLRATMFAFEDKGIAYLKGEGRDPQIVRTVVGLDAVAAEKVALRARAAREVDGRLTGHAAGEEMDGEAQEVVLLDDVRRVFQATDAMHLGDIVTGLAQLRPALYGALDAASLGSQLRTAGVQVASVHVADKPRRQASNKGVKREWLDVSTTRVIGDEDNVRQLRPAADRRER